MSRMKKIKKIVYHYGRGNQINKVIEELDELKEALEGNHSVEHILEESVDVMIMLNQLMVIYGFSNEMVEATTDYKIERTLMRIREEEKNDTKRSV